MQTKTLISDTPEWKALKAHVEEIDQTHLRDLLKVGAVWMLTFTK